MGIGDRVRAVARGRVKVGLLHQVQGLILGLFELPFDRFCLVPRRTLRHRRLQVGLGLGLGVRAFRHRRLEQSG